MKANDVHHALLHVEICSPEIIYKIHDMVFEYKSRGSGKSSEGKVMDTSSEMLVTNLSEKDTANTGMYYVFTRTFK